MESLEARIEKLDEYQIAEAFNHLIRELSQDATAGRGFENESLPQAEEEAAQAVAEAFPGLAGRLDTLHQAADPWSRADFYRAFLLTYVGQSQDPDYLDPLRRALSAAESDRVQPAGIPPLLIGVGIVMLLQTDFSVSYENVDGKKKLKFDFSKKPSSETLIGKLLKLLPG